MRAGSQRGGWESGLQVERPNAGPESLTRSVAAPCSFSLDPALLPTPAPGSASAFPGACRLPSSFSLSHVTRPSQCPWTPGGHREGLFSKSGGAFKIGLCPPRTSAQPPLWGPQCQLPPTEQSWAAGPSGSQGGACLTDRWRLAKVLC